MLLYKNFLGVVFVLGLILSISPISAYSIETQTHNNNTFDMNVLTPSIHMKTLLSSTGNADNELNCTDKSNESSTSLSNRACDIYISPKLDRQLYLWGIYLLVMSTIILIIPSQSIYINLGFSSLLGAPGFVLVYNFRNHSNDYRRC
jgi:hypothetical protein